MNTLLTKLRNFESAYNELLTELLKDEKCKQYKEKNEPK